jgi:hypothetical protein
VAIGDADGDAGSLVPNSSEKSAVPVELAWLSAATCVPSALAHRSVRRSADTAPTGRAHPALTAEAQNCTSQLCH